jgi:hypothetical protein
MFPQGLPTSGDVTVVILASNSIYPWFEYRTSFGLFLPKLLMILLSSSGQ